MTKVHSLFPITFVLFSFLSISFAATNSSASNLSTNFNVQKTSLLCDTISSSMVNGNIIIMNSYGLGNTLDSDYSTMYYCPSIFNEEHGGGFQLHYTDQGGSGMDAYPNVKVGGIKSRGVYTPGDKNIVGMPALIESLPTSMNFEWITSQKNAFDGDDKWMASVNFIFDAAGTSISEPETASRDFDIVVKSQSHNFSDDLNDLSKEETTGTAFWYFARWDDGSLKPYEYNFNNINYQYAVRYKFFFGAGDKDDKVHVKFIPFGSAGAPPVTLLNVVDLIAASREYFQYAALPAEQEELAKAKVAKNGTWLKAINAGYEVYTGKSILKTDKFKVNIHPTNINLKHRLDPSTSPNPAMGTLKVDLGKECRNVKINVRNILGMLVASYDHLNGQFHQINIDEKNGVYLLEVLSETERIVIKVIKE